MKSYIRYGEDDCEIKAQVETAPISEAHFKAICGIVKLAIVGVTAVGVVFLSGTAGLLFDAGIAFLYGIYRLVQNC